MSKEDKPLVTFALFAYNQEGYIREAVEGALSQDYPNLEIILSDDCSQDRTYELMQELAARYVGPHVVRLNRNPRNLSIGGHVNAVNRLARGKLVVAAAGDDISLPGRTSALVDAWLGTGKRAGLLHSVRREFLTGHGFVRDDACRCLDALESLERIVSENAHVSGATEAWDPELFRLFGDFLDTTFHEDCALTFRSVLANRPVVYVDQVLVLWRQQTGVTFEANLNRHGYDSSTRLRELIRLRSISHQFQADLKLVPNEYIADLTMKRAARADAAIQFELGWPSPRQFIGLIRSTNLAFTARLTVKKAVNSWRDWRYQWPG
ncbi:MAG: glycosyltransferase family 2 protein [Proteobacteria bacterium]|nr:glycosyltransferase family 2 protein [Pseudomonadota bacterium]